MLRITLYMLTSAAFVLLGTAACREESVAATTAEVLVARGAVLPTDPSDDAWRQLPEHVAPLILQDLVEPRALVPTTAEVRVRAVTDGREVAFRLEWADATLNDLPGAARFSDACAVQVPAGMDASVPAPQMGEVGRPVEITYWSAAWQAQVNGRGDSITDLYPRAYVDHYPFEAPSLKKDSPEQQEMADRYAPARALRNTAAGPHDTPVQDLIAEGPGTLTPAPTQGSRGQGRRTQTGWSVVITRRLPAGLDGPAGRSHIALAVWEGEQHEVGARKMRTGWVPLLIASAP